MPFCKVFSGAVNGIDASIINIEVNLDYRGFPSFTIVGLPAKEIDESRERVRSAIKNSGFHFPDGKITVNLAPADINKRGSLYDLPIAIGILTAAGKINRDVNEYMIFGELSLDGTVNGVKGVIPILEIAEDRFNSAIIPDYNKAQAGFFRKLSIYPVTHLKQVISFLNGLENIHFEIQGREFNSEVNFDLGPYTRIKSQILAKRALLIAAAGKHNIAFSGPPGVGKSMLAGALKGLLPPLNYDEAYEVGKIYSAIEGINSTWINNTSRPFRAPHHSISKSGLVGGGNPIRPGEITLAHNGVLYLDELPEFNSECIEALRQPMENHYITISRANGTYKFPSNFLLATSFNLCPCGFYGHNAKQCVCTPMQIKKYLGKISGPIMDRIDLHVFCTSVDIKTLHSIYPEINIDRISKSLKNALELQSIRYKNSHIKFNSDASNDQVENNFLYMSQAKEYFEKIGNTSLLSIRGYFKTLKIARTIADLEGAESISEKHISEALQFRLNFDQT